MIAGDETIAVRAEERLDLARLEPYLRAHLPRAEGAFRVRQFPGGHANLTYLVRFGDDEYVLRRPPLGPVPPGAHDMRREHRVLSSLWRGFPLAPRSYVLCTDPAVIGADFFVMERRRGIAFRDDVPPPWRERPETLRALGLAMVDTLADLHAVDPDAVGLGDLGKPEGYLARQLAGWTERWRSARTPDVADGEALLRRLRAALPVSSRVALVHNDYKLDNLLLDPADPARILAVLDWDMCTRGDPLSDLGYLLALWIEPGEDASDAEGWMPTRCAGFPRRDEATERYARRSGASVEGLHWYVVFNTFRFAVILQQITLRYRRGQTHDERFARFGERVDALLRRGAALAERGLSP